MPRADMFVASATKFADRQLAPECTRMLIKLHTHAHLGLAVAGDLQPRGTRVDTWGKEGQTGLFTSRPQPNNALQKPRPNNAYKKAILAASRRN